MTWQSLAEGIAQARRELSARERRDVSQAEIAEAVGVTVPTYSRWEKGQRTPDEADVQRLAKFFGVTPAYLRYGIPGNVREGATGTPAKGAPATKKKRA